jgi:hypothetical protein
MAGVHREPDAARLGGGATTETGPMDSVDRRAARLARTQRGFVTRQQLVHGAGISYATVARRLTSGQWSEPLPNVIDLGTHQPSWHGRLQCILLAAGPASWVSHDSAAHLHGFLDVGRPGRADVVVRRGRSSRVGAVRLHTTTAIAEDETTVVDGLRCTTRARTLLDLARATSVDDLEVLAADLARRDRRALRQVGVLLTRYPHARGRRALLTAISRLPADVARLGSPLEVVGVQSLLRWGLPRPVLQYHVRDETGAVIKRVDAAWPQARVIVEFDGAAYHDTSAARRHDEAVRARMRALGWFVEVLRWGDLQDGSLDEAATRLGRLLRG